MAEQRPGKTPAASMREQARKQREAAALRDNLRRRKEQARAQASGADDGSGAAPVLPISEAESREDRRMFIAMNRFKVRLGEEAAFEAVWQNREVHIDSVPGFVAFHLLRGPAREDHVLYSSHTIWQSKSVFEDWTRSEAFRAAHRDAGSNKPLTLSHPEFEGFEVIQEVHPA